LPQSQFLSRHFGEIKEKHERTDSGKQISGPKTEVGTSPVQKNNPSHGAEIFSEIFYNL
jgi:hypothetical protein